MPDPIISGNYMALGWPPQLLGGSPQVTAVPGIPVNPDTFLPSGAPDAFVPNVGAQNYETIYQGAPAQINNWGDVQNIFNNLYVLFSGPNLFDVPYANPGMPANNNVPYPGFPPEVPATPPVGCFPTEPPGPTDIPCGVDTLPKNPDGVPVRIIEVGTDGKVDQHSNQVAEIYSHTLGNDGANASVTILGEDDKDKDDKDSKSKLPPGGVELPEQCKSKKDLDQFIDFKGTYVLSQMAKEINDTEGGVINASAGWTRVSTYMDVISVLQENPALAEHMDLTKADLKQIKFQPQEKGSDEKIIDPASIPNKVKEKVVEYVDKRFEPQDSAYKKALGIYQDATHKAVTERNVNIVVAAANDGEYRKIFTSAKSGADTNYLALSEDVISVAAADTHGTADLSDDTIAKFSSFGVGRYTPTIAAIGVDLPTSYGPASGTSFASPYVAAVVTRMLQANPDLKPGRIKEILQDPKVALNTNAPEVAEGAGMLDAEKALDMAKSA